MASEFAELEAIAADCEEAARQAFTDGDQGLQRAWSSVAVRIRHAAKKLSAKPLMPVYGSKPVEE